MLALAAFLLAEARRFPLAALAAAGALLTRSAGIAVVAGIAVLAWPSVRGVAWVIGSAIVGFALFPLTLHLQTHDAWGFLHAQAQWNRSLSPAGPLRRDLGRTQAAGHDPAIDDLPPRARAGSRVARLPRPVPRTPPTRLAPPRRALRGLRSGLARCCHSRTRRAPTRSSRYRASGSSSSRSSSCWRASAVGPRVHTRRSRGQRHPARRRDRRVGHLRLGGMKHKLAAWLALAAVLIAQGYASTYASGSSKDTGVALPVLDRGRRRGRLRGHAR